MEKTNNNVSRCDHSGSIWQEVFQFHGQRLVQQGRHPACRERRELWRLQRSFRLRDRMEACATAHHWARELARLGHDVKLIHRPT